MGARLAPICVFGWIVLRANASNAMSLICNSTGWGKFKTNLFASGSGNAYFILEWLKYASGAASES